MTCKFYEVTVCKNPECPYIKCQVSGDHCVCKYYEPIEFVYSDVSIDTVSIMHKKEMYITIQALQNEHLFTVYAIFDLIPILPLKFDSMTISYDGMVDLVYGNKHLTGRIV